jgi:hypothetical protein
MGTRNWWAAGELCFVTDEQGDERSWGSLHQQLRAVAARETEVTVPSGWTATTV